MLRQVRRGCSVPLVDKSVGKSVDNLWIERWITLWITLVRCGRWEGGSIVRAIGAGDRAGS